MKGTRTKRKTPPRDGRPEEAYVEYDSNAKAYNAVLVVDGCRVEFGTLDIDHAQDLTDAINACSWVQAHDAKGD
jgi:hypothetical protein